MAPMRPRHPPPSSKARGWSRDVSDADGFSAGLEGPEPIASGRYLLQAPGGFQAEGMPRS